MTTFPTTRVNVPAHTTPSTPTIWTVLDRINQRITRADIRLTEHHPVIGYTLTVGVGLAVIEGVLRATIG